MTITLYQLIKDTLPRLAGLEKTSGVDVIQADNAIQSLIFKRLLSRNSDLIAKGSLSMSIGAGGYSATLPDDFISMAGRPKCETLYTDWMAGTVTSYNSGTGALVVNITSASGTDTLTDWNISKAALPGASSTLLGSSTTSLTVGTGSKSLTTQLGLSIITGDYLIIFPTSLPESLAPQYHRLDPDYLDEDEEHSDDWWYWYISNGYRGYNYESAERPKLYKIIDDTFYMFPATIYNITITGLYFKALTALSAMTDNIPFRSMFDEVFREGVVRIIVEGILVPDKNADFLLMIHREVDTVINSRIHVTPYKYRMKRTSWI